MNAWQCTREQQAFLEHIERIVAAEVAPAAPAAPADDASRSDAAVRYRRWARAWLGNYDDKLEASREAVEVVRAQDAAAGELAARMLEAEARLAEHLRTRLEAER